MKKYHNDGFMVDVKYEQHISSLSPVHRRSTAEFGAFRYVEHDPLKVIPQHLPQEETEYLFNLLHEVEENWKILKSL